MSFDSSHRRKVDIVELLELTMVQDRLELTAFGKSKTLRSHNPEVFLSNPFRFRIASAWAFVLTFAADRA
ncbi:hypothetical protein BASA81_013351 [Batrachochytrium salamandrivorans]|nr:hypothetical protein BASA81_013351 [Batrachochytrium salamandrivorans]